jgi:ABC-type transport system involved in multi-copper enzyme maturation permease subunit
MGLARAEWLRFRKRRSNQLIVIAVPLLAAFTFLAGYASTADAWPTFDPAETRARIMAEGFLDGVPPEEAEATITSIIEDERRAFEQYHEQLAISRARFAFPQSLVTMLGNGTFIFVALILVTATSIGDEFGWGTIRTALLASSHRRRMLTVRLLALALVVVFVLGVIVLLGTVLPALLGAAGAPLPSASPIDAVGLLALLLGQLLVCIVVIAFAALITLIVRSGSLTLVVVLVYVLVEAAVVSLLMSWESFQYDGANEGLLDAFPVRGTFSLMDVSARAAGGVPSYAGEVIVRDLSAAAVPVVALVVWAGLFATLAFRRFSRMDIVE